VVLSGLQLDTFALQPRGRRLLPAAGGAQGIDQSGLQFAHVNTEVIARDMLNFNPQKVTSSLYLPSMKAGRFVWDVILRQPGRAPPLRGERPISCAGAGIRSSRTSATGPRKDLDFYSSA